MKWVKLKKCKQFDDIANRIVFPCCESHVGICVCAKMRYKNGLIQQKMKIVCKNCGNETVVTLKNKKIGNPIN